MNAIWLDDGRVRAIARSEEIVAAYLARGVRTQPCVLLDRRPDAAIQYSSICAVDKDGRVSQTVPDSHRLGIRLGIEVTRRTAPVYFAFTLQNSDGGQEKGVVNWDDDRTITIEGTVTDGSGDRIKTYTYRLKKSQ